MTMKIFLGFQRKPAKSQASAVARAFGMTEQPNDDGNWVFGKGRFRVRLEDLREDLKPEYREWADEVGWTQNWAISIAVHHRNRTDVDYIKWHALVAVIMEAYDTNVLWTDAGTDTPQYNMRLNDFIPSLVSAEADDLKPEEALPEPEPQEVERAPERAPARTPAEEIPDSVLSALKEQLRAEMSADAAAPTEEEPKRLVALEPVEVDEEDFDTFDDWDDDDDDDDDAGDIGPITDWD